MGSIGSSSTSTAPATAPATRENEYGFEIENNNNPDLAFTDRHWAEMAKLRDKGLFADGDLRSAVNDRISDLVSEYDDLALYDEDLTNLRERVENNGVTEDEYWAAYHAMADMLGIKQKRSRRR